MRFTDAKGLPIAVDTSRAGPHWLTLVDGTLDVCFLEELPEYLIGDTAYDSDRLDQQLEAEQDLEMIAPHRINRCKPPSQDSRALRRYKRR